MDYDVVIIGAGVVGMACSAILSDSGFSVLVLDRNPSFGWETSSRNSEVIHAGIYYPTDSLKSKLCVAGNRSLRAWCDSHNVPYRKIGKYIIAINKSDEESIERTLNQAQINGVEGICRISNDTVKNEEPNIKFHSALWSPDTSIIDSHALMDSFQHTAQSNNTDFAWKHTVSGIDKIPDGYELYLIDPMGEPCQVNTRNIVNSAGLDCDTIAQMAGIDIKTAGYELHYCRGHYFRLISSKKHLVNHLIYPVPQKNFAGLGIHVTLELNGEVKFGPDTMYLNERKQDYSIPEHLHEAFFKSASSYLNGIESDDLYAGLAGIRPKLQAEGEEVKDFIIKEESERGLPGLVNLIGIESPGLTSCLEIAALVKKLLSH